ncbi:hypothetical protein [Natrialba taiwanensis]|uniref:hypothetical protein n=1 Tax=Natrialba taiwanensis TaxID=160846 RepID=UPI0012694825|nr:hypothetical protein [Natrialba taiwanensis]
MAKSDSKEITEKQTTKVPKRADIADSISPSQNRVFFRRAFFKSSLATIAAIVGVGSTSLSVAAEEDTKYKKQASDDDIIDIVNDWEEEILLVLSKKESIPDIHSTSTTSSLHRFIRNQDPILIKYKDHMEGTEYLVFTSSGPVSDFSIGLGRDRQDFFYKPENIQDGIEIRDELRQNVEEVPAQSSGGDLNSQESIEMKSDCDPLCDDYPNSCGPDCGHNHCCVPYGEEEDMCTVFNGACGRWDSVVTGCCCNCHTCYDLRIDCCPGHTWCPTGGCPSPNPQNC